VSSLERRPAHLRVTRPIALQLEPSPRAWRAVSIRWKIGADALRTTRPDLAGAVLSGPTPAPDQELTLQLRIDLEATPTLRAELIGPASSTSVPLPAGTQVHVEHDDELSLLHIDAISERSAVLRATIRLEEAGVRLLYCRTSLIDALLLPGGRYEPDQAEGHDR